MPANSITLYIPGAVRGEALEKERFQDVRWTKRACTLKARGVVVGRDAIPAGSPKFSGRSRFHLKTYVENNGVSPDNGKTRLNLTNAHTQGVSSAAGSRFCFRFFLGAGHAKRVFGPRPSLTAPTGSKDTHGHGVMRTSPPPGGGGGEGDSEFRVQSLY